MGTCRQSLGAHDILYGGILVGQIHGINDGLYHIAVDSDVKSDPTSSDVDGAQVANLEREGKIITCHQSVFAGHIGETQNILGEMIILHNALHTQVAFCVHTIVHPVAATQDVGGVNGADLDSRDRLGLIIHLLVVKTNSQTVTFRKVDLVGLLQLDDIPTGLPAHFAGPLGNFTCQLTIEANRHDKQARDGRFFHQTNPERDDLSSLEHSQIISIEIGCDGVKALQETLSPTSGGEIIGRVVTQQFLVRAKLDGPCSQRQHECCHQ